MAPSRALHIHERNSERRFEHAQRRARELLPLCEDALSRKLTVPLVLEASSWEALFSRTMKRVFRTLLPSFEVSGLDPELSASLTDAQTIPFPDSSFIFLAMSAYADRYAQYFSDAFGYCDRERRVISINIDKYRPGLPVSDYVIAHELVHLILVELGLHVPINSNLVLSEGAATFYGNQVTRVVHPDFDITFELSHFGPVYAYGYFFFRVVKEAGFEPVEAITEHSPIIQVPFDCANCGGVHKRDRLMDMEDYVGSLQLFRYFRTVISGSFESIGVVNAASGTSGSDPNKGNM